MKLVQVGSGMFSFREARYLFRYLSRYRILTCLISARLHNIAPRERVTKDNRTTISDLDKRDLNLILTMRLLRGIIVEATRCSEIPINCNGGI